MADCRKEWSAKKTTGSKKAIIAAIKEKAYYEVPICYMDKV
jgi:hypothetical protein